MNSLLYFLLLCNNQHGYERISEPLLLQQNCIQLTKKRGFQARTHGGREPLTEYQQSIP